jgi:flavin-dependent dehydrogenase
MYDVAVVGAGLIGAAAAKYLAKKGLKVEAGLQRDSKSQWFIGGKGEHWVSEFPCRQATNSEQVTL